MDKTENLNLNLPNVNDYYDINVTNENTIKIDETFGNVEEMKTALGVENVSDALVKVFQLGNKHKQTLVSNLIAMGIEADTSESWDDLLAKMGDGSAASVTSEEIKLNCGDVYTIPKGYHDGTGTVVANSLASQTQATATASDIASGKTAWVNGNKVTGKLS